ncbi:MAG: radical SAM protein [Verrucomicrobia bacterium]|nr:radical SAM protein [Verrucomicrobiota bacterium]
MKHNKYSDLKILAFPDKIAAFQEGRITAPIYVRIKPTNRCNHGCRFCCYSDGTKRPKDRADLHLQASMHESMREQDVMPLAKAVELLNDLRDMGTKAVTFSGGGEPLLHPEIVAIMNTALANGLDLSIITNGQLLSGERAQVLAKAKWVRVSIDYTTAKQMVDSRNVADRSFDQVLDNLRNFSKIKSSDTDPGINFNVTGYNYEGLLPFAKTLKDCGVENVRFSPVYVSNFREYHEPIAPRVREQLREIQAICDDRFSVNSTYDLDSPSKSPNRAFTRCLYMQTVPVVGADLNVYACHNTAYSEHGKIGSMRDRSFKQLWFSEDAKKAFCSLNPSVVCRHECANHHKVELFNTLAHASLDNFV